MKIEDVAAVVPTAPPTEMAVGDKGRYLRSPNLAPPAVARGERVLARIDWTFAWFDGWVARWLPPELNPLAHAGAAANFALTVAIVSGVALLVWYSPSLAQAYPSVSAMRPGTLGGWVRAVHRYSSDLAMLFVVWHAARVFFARKFAGTRWLPWISGVGLIGLVWVIGWTGYWLVWDQPAQQIAITSMRLLDVLPIFGEPLGRLYVADRTVPSLLFFVVFFTHMLLPLGIAVGLAVHLTRVSRARLFPRRATMVALTAGLAVAGWLVPAPLDAPAAMAEKASGFTVDAWYLTPLALALRLQSGGLWLALGGGLLATAALPWLLGRRRAPRAYQAVVEESRCHACTQCVQDCPFDAITMIPRTDGRRFEAQAFVDPAKCVGCGVCAGSCDSEANSLPWFDTRREEARIENEVAAARANDGHALVAFVPGDIDGGLALFQLARWRERLPGYAVQFVPTASWVRPKLVERLLATGTRGVLVVRDARAEAAARDGNRWVEARLASERTPIFRPERAGGSQAWRVVDFDRARVGDLTARAVAFRERVAGSEARTRPHAARPEVGPNPRKNYALTAAAALALALGAATVLPSRLSVTNPAPADPELVFSFKALGERLDSAAAPAEFDPSTPVHMRGRAVAKPHRAEVVVRLTIDGTTEERRFRAKGVSRDGPALDEWRMPLGPGAHEIAIELIAGPQGASETWHGQIHAVPRRRHVISYEAGRGFRRE